MWGRKRKAAEALAPEVAPPGPLKEAVRKTRIEIAEKSSVVVDLRDAELARLELLNDALDPLFEETPPDIDLFDRAISRGDTPRLWIDAIAHVVMGRDKRHYRFVHDTATAGRCWRNQMTSPRSSRRLPITWQRASSSASGRWPRMKTRCTRDCTEACMAVGPAGVGACSAPSCSA